MGLLNDIQGALLSEQPLGPILLKLRFLAARLGSDTLADWVKHEAEGYPADVELPDYRQFPVSYTGGFNGAFGRQIKNIAIPSLLIAQIAGEQWLTHKERQSISAIEDLIIASQKADKNPEINASNLVLLLSDNVFEDMACHSVHGVISRQAMVEMIATVRGRVMELTLEIEKKIPEAAGIVAGQAAQPTEPEKAAVVTNITNQTIYGAVGANVANSGAAHINIAVQQGDVGSLAKALQDGGIPSPDAEQFAKIIASEKPDDSDQPFGKAAKAWIGANIGKAINGTWKVGVAVATGLLTDAAKHYYGLK